MTDTSITADLFRRACGLWATGVSIVTTADTAGKPYGLTMNAVSSLSLDPPMMLVCVDKGSDTLAPMLASRVFCVNVLTSAQQDLSNRFAKKGHDKFEAVAWHPGTVGAPVLAHTLVSIECEIADVVTGGDHEICCGVVRDIIANDSVDVEPLLYYGGRYGALGKA
ncbi:MAG: flavin reductase family protein [Gammaproteobacteria bacterium]|nr:flavin reductase family protein [Gammaproteobacteria bacterium]